jgi:N-acetylmuramoyl-L-alanine amidase-like protein
MRIGSQRRPARRAAGVLLLAAALIAPAGARATTVPATLARTAVVGDRAVAPGLRVDFLGVQWHGAVRAPGARVRFRRAGRWGGWRALRAGDVRPRGRFASELLAAHRATAYQVHVPAGVRDVRAVAINTTDGPSRTLARSSAAGGGGPLAGLCLRDRANWGADESLRFDADGNERWPPVFFAIQRLTVHHTALDPGSDPAAAVRAIYRYHAVDLGWGDIGYQLLIDDTGCVYEGRASGDDGVPVLSGLPEPGAAPLAVNGGHVLGFNPGNVGVALIGDFTTAAPSRAALRALIRTLAVLAVVGGLDPLATGPYVNPLTGATRQTATISGHRDWLSTECPGERLYALLPAIRRRVATLVAGGPAGA